MAKLKKAVAKAPLSEVPAELEEELLGDASEFEEHLSQADLAIPFLQVIQAQSPQVTEGNDQFIEGAVKGQLFNTVTKRCYEARELGVQVVPIKYKRSFIEWIRRSEGGGFVAEHPPEHGAQIHTVRNEDNEDIVQENSPLGEAGHQVVETASHFLMVIDPETGEGMPCVLSLSSSQFKVSKNWNSQIATRIVRTANGKVKPPRFWDVWRLKTVVLTNDDGTWYGYDLTNEGSTRETLADGVEVYEACRSFARSLKTGERTADYSKAPLRSGGVKPSDNIEDDMPF